MNLDEMYGGEFKRIPLLQDDADWSDAMPELEWDDADTASLAGELIGRRHEEY